MYAISPIELIEQEDQENNKEKVKLVVEEMAKKNPLPTVTTRPVRDMVIPCTTNMMICFEKTKPGGH